MTETIALSDGRVIVLGGLAQGGSKNETRFGRVGQRRVVVKLEGEHGRVAGEERALRFLAAHDVRVPSVVGSGATRDGRRFLVISHEAGAPTVTPAGWARFGRDLAALIEVPIDDGCPLPRVSMPEFVLDQRERLQLVAPLLSQISWTRSQLRSRGSRTEIDRW